MGSAIIRDRENPQQSSDSERPNGAPASDIYKDITDESERVRMAYRTTGDVARIEDEEERRVSATYAIVVTDSRLLVVADPPGAGNRGERTHSLPFDELGGISIVESHEDTLAISTTDGIRWEFPLPTAVREDDTSLVAHLHWIGELRSRIVACANDVDLAANGIREYATEMQWADAESAYTNVRDKLDRLIDAIHWTEPVEDDAIAPGLTDMERTLERAYAQFLLERAESQRELASQLVENEDYGQTWKVLETAREYIDRATDRVEAVRRGDAFRFGEERKLRDELDRLRWKLDTIAAEPIRQAHEARIQAADTDDPAIAVDHWETAFRRYGTLLSVDWDMVDSVPGSRQEIHAEMIETVDRLVECHRELARDTWDRGIRAEQDDLLEDAIPACKAAIGHLERAEELASEFREDGATNIRKRRERMEVALQDMQKALDDQRDGEEPAETDTAAGIETGAEETLDAIDTHQEIILDMNIKEQSADEAKHDELLGEEEADRIQRQVRKAVLEQDVDQTE